MLRQFFQNEKSTPIDIEIDAVLKEMHAVGVKSEEYPQLMRHLERLQTIKTKESRDPVSRDTIAIVVGNLLGIFIIVAYERGHVITSKGINQIIRTR